MTGMKDLGNILVGLGMILCAALLIVVEPTFAYSTIIFVLCLGLLIVGIRDLIFYITMAKHMTGGKGLLYRAVILIDIGLFTLSLSRVPLSYVMLYLAGVHLVSGGIDILRSLEAKKLQAESWRLQFFSGIINVIMAVLCLIFFRSTTTAISIYALGLAWSGIMKVIQALRKKAIIYIQ